MDEFVELLRNITRGDSKVQGYILETFNTHYSTRTQDTAFALTNILFSGDQIEPVTRKSAGLVLRSLINSKGITEDIAVPLLNYISENLPGIERTLQKTASSVFTTLVKKTSGIGGEWLISEVIKLIQSKGTAAAGSELFLFFLEDLDSQSLTAFYGENAELFNSMLQTIRANQDPAIPKIFSELLIKMSDVVDVAYLARVLLESWPDDIFDIVELTQSLEFFYLFFMKGFSYMVAGSDEVAKIRSVVFQVLEKGSEEDKKVSLQILSTLSSSYLKQFLAEPWMIEYVVHSLFQNLVLPDAEYKGLIDGTISFFEISIDYTTRDASSKALKHLAKKLKKEFRVQFLRSAFAACTERLQGSGRDREAAILGLLKVEKAVGMTPEFVDRAVQIINSITDIDPFMYPTFFYCTAAYSDRFKQIEDVEKILAFILDYGVLSSKMKVGPKLRSSLQISATGALRKLIERVPEISQSSEISHYIILVISQELVALMQNTEANVEALVSFINCLDQLFMDLKPETFLVLFRDVKELEGLLSVVLSPLESFDLDSRYTLNFSIFNLLKSLVGKMGYLRYNGIDTTAASEIFYESVVIYVLEPCIRSLDTGTTHQMLSALESSVECVADYIEEKLYLGTRYESNFRSTEFLDTRFMVCFGLNNHAILRSTISVLGLLISFHEIDDQDLLRRIIRAVFTVTLEGENESRYALSGDDFETMVSNVYWLLGETIKFLINVDRLDILDLDGIKRMLDYAEKNVLSKLGKPDGFVENVTIFWGICSWKFPEIVSTNVGTLENVAMCLNTVNRREDRDIVFSGILGVLCFYAKQLPLKAISILSDSVGHVLYNDSGEPDLARFNKLWGEQMSFIFRVLAESFGRDSVISVVQNKVPSVPSKVFSNFIA